MSEPDLDGYWSEPEGQADTTESEFGRFWSQPEPPPRQPNAARPVKLLARLAGVIALVFAVVAVFLLRPARGHDTADVIITPTRTATAPSRAASPKPSHPRATRPRKRPAHHRTRPKHAGAVTRVVVEQVPPTVTAQPSPKPSARPASKPTKNPVKAPAKKTVKVEVSGEVTCLSGNSVEGVWVQADVDSGFAPWQGVNVSGKAFGSTSKWWWWLPRGESYSLHVGCGGTQASWAVAVYTPVVSGTPNSFDCIDIASDAGYGTCYVA
jgi:hypothetical protein